MGQMSVHKWPMGDKREEDFVLICGLKWEPRREQKAQDLGWVLKYTELYL